MEEENTNPKKLKPLIEAALFLSSEALSLPELSRLVHAEIDDTRTALNELSVELQERDSALEIKEEGNAIRLSVRDEFDDFSKNFSTIPELSKTVLKTLAFISFKQPVKQSDVIRYRNNKAYEHIGILEDKGFIRRETVGKTFIIFTTKKFVEYFGEPKKPLVEQKQNAP